MKRLFFIGLLFLPSLLLAEGPLFQHKDTFANQEFQNVYQDLRNEKLDASNLFISASVYGVVCDSTTDTYGTLQNALNSVAGNTLYLPKGRCYVNGNLIIPASTTLVGAGIGNTIIVHGSGVTSGPFIQLGGYSPLIPYANIENLTIDGNYPNIPTLTANELTTNWKSIVQNVEIRNFHARGIDIGSYGQESQVLGCILTGGGDVNTSTGTPQISNQDGIFGVLAVAPSQLRGMKIIGNTITEMRTNGIFTEGAGLIISNNYLYHNHRQAFPTGGGQIAVGSGTVIGNTIMNGGDGADCIELNGNGQAIGNYCFSHPYYGIFIQNNPHNVVVGNIVDRTTLSGIAVNVGVSSFTISSNRILNSGNVGIFISTGASDNFIIIGNELSNNTQGNIQDNSTGAHKKIESNLGYMENPYVNAQIYGVVGDSITDNAANLTKALNANPGKTVFLPPGRYYINNNIIVPSSTTLKGAGIGVTVLVHGIAVTGSPFIQLGAYSPLVPYANIENLTIDGNYPNIPSYTGAELTTNWKSVVRHIELKNFHARGIDIGSYGQESEVTDSVLTGGGDVNTSTGTPQISNQDGIFGVLAVAPSVLRGMKITNNTISEMRTNGIFTEGAGMIISGNYLYHNHRQAYPTGGGQIAFGSGTVVGNTIMNGGDGADCIEMNGEGMAIGNDCFNHPYFGIFLQNGKNNLVLGNRISQTTLAAIGVGPNISSFTISSNRIFNNGNHGIFITTGSSDNYLIIGNELSNNGFGNIQDNGTGLNKRIVGNLGFPDSYYGVFLSSIMTTGSADVALASSGVFQDLLTISLTTGTWELSASTTFNTNGATDTGYAIGISTTSGSATTNLISGYNQIVITSGGTAYDSTSIQLIPIPKYFLTAAYTQNVYLKIRGTFSAGTPKATRANLTATRQ